MADTQQRGIRVVELTDEEKAVLRECRINSVYFRGVPLGIGSVLILRQAIKYGLPLPFAKRFPGIFYTDNEVLHTNDFQAESSKFSTLESPCSSGIFGVGFIAGITSYHSTCVEKIMRLENSKLADQVRASRRALSHGSSRGDWQMENNNHERQEDLQGKALTNNRFSEPTAPSQDYSPSNVPVSPPVGSSEEAPPPPSLYFDVDSDKENKYTSYGELRKKHRERWVPPNASTSGSVRSEQRSPQQGDGNFRPSSSEAPSSWFDMDSNANERSHKQSNRESAPVRNSAKPSYRQGPPPKKNKYGDVIEG
ncbi:OCIA domain-containing protein 1-like isoform X2 [Montipora foliosa]|uniref:OCIA domain-containing protein 1-like isoform X2 n=1 Tax=Montipora foliosa TaxID=591990 RepID=UPI0035F13665